MAQVPLKPDADDSVGQSMFEMSEAIDRESKRWFTLVERVLMTGAVGYAASIAPKATPTAYVLELAFFALRLMLSMWLTWRLQFEIWMLGRLLFRAIRVKKLWLQRFLKGVSYAVTLAWFAAVYWVVTTELRLAISLLARQPAG